MKADAGQDIRMRGAEAVSLFCRLNMNTRTELPVRQSEMGLLMLVVSVQEPVTPVQAAAFFRVSKPMITSMVNSLVKKGYLTRVPSLPDRRKYTLCAEPLAVKLVEDTRDEYLRTMSALKEKMGLQSFESLIRLLEQANEIIQEER